MKKVLTIVSRQSKLALWQANHLKDSLQALHPHCTIHILGITTEGDKAISANLSALGGKGVFVKELEEALLAGTADVAIHCVKDMPQLLPPGLIMPVILAREDVKDVLLTQNKVSLIDLPVGAKVGTSSIRRSAQLKFLRPDLQILPLRGNVDTRIKKLKAGEYDAIVLAAAGIHRLGLKDEISQYLAVEDHLPAPGQGALVLECRADDKQTLKMITALNDPKTAEEIQTERGLTALLGGSCDLPLAALAVKKKDHIAFNAMVVSPSGKERICAQAMGERTYVVRQVAQQLLQQNADTILSAVAKPLSGKRFLNTRPDEQGGHLSRRLHQLGAEVVNAPALMINYFEADALEAVVSSMHFDQVIVTSQNVLPAARKFLAAWSKKFQKPILTIGGPSAKRLQAEGLLAQAAPAPYNSEALLNLPVLKKVAGNSILILKGVGGLSRLAPELTKRGAQVFTFDCYERQAAAIEPTVFGQSYDAVIATSDAGLSALMATCPGTSQKDFLQSQLIVMSERTQKLAESLHFIKTAWVTSVASDAGLILSILENS